MSAVRLEVDTHIVAGAATSVQNLSKCITQANVQIDELVINSIAAAEAVLTDTEKDLGVLVADIGGGTTDIAIFADGAIYHSAVLPVGGINVTNDVAIGLRTSLNLAEVACLLGYAEVSAFSFAFKRFPGKTPSQARRRSLAESRKTLAGIRSLRLAVIY